MRSEKADKTRRGTLACVPQGRVMGWRVEPGRELAWAQMAECRQWEACSAEMGPVWGRQGQDVAGVGELSQGEPSHQSSFHQEVLDQTPRVRSRRQAWEVFIYLFFLAFRITAGCENL